MPQDYHPVSSDFFDQLESLAVLNRDCEIIYRDEQGARAVIRDRIQQLSTQDGATFLKTASGIQIRLDRLVEVNGKLPEGAC